MEFSHDGNLLATGDKGGRVVIFQRDENVSFEIQGEERSTASNTGTLFAVCVGGPAVAEKCAQKERLLRVHDVPVTRTRIRLPEVAGD